MNTMSLNILTKIINQKEGGVSGLANAGSSDKGRRGMLTVADKGGMGVGKC